MRLSVPEAPVRVKPPLPVMVAVWPVAKLSREPGALSVKVAQVKSSAKVIPASVVCHTCPPLFRPPMTQILFSKTTEECQHIPEQPGNTPASVQFTPSLEYHTSAKRPALRPPMTHILPSSTTEVCSYLSGQGALPVAWVQFTPSVEYHTSSVAPPL